MLLGDIILVQPYMNLDIVQILCILVNKVIVYECEHIIMLCGTEKARLFVIAKLLHNRVNPQTFFKICFCLSINM